MLEAIRWHARSGGMETRRAVRQLFLFIGAEPNTDWLGGCGLELDEKGFVRTGSSCTQGRLPLETSRPGVFAVGDVRSGSVKRVAASVGDGAQVVAAIHAYLARLRQEPVVAPVRRPSDATDAAARALRQSRERRRKIMSDDTRIAEGMEVIGADGVHLGTVDRIEGDRIKLVRADSGAGRARRPSPFPADRPRRRGRGRPGPPVGQCRECLVVRGGEGRVAEIARSLPSTGE